MNPPPLNHDLRFFQSIEYLTIQQLIPEFSIKRFIVAIFPGTAWFDEQRTNL